MDEIPETGSTTVNDGARYSNRGRQIRTPTRFLVVGSPIRLSKRRGRSCRSIPARGRRQVPQRDSWKLASKVD